MSSCSASARRAKSPSEFVQTLGQSVRPFAMEEDWRSAARSVERCPTTISTFALECWQRNEVMHAAFEQSESVDGEQSRERSEERRLDEEAWPRMDNEGGPDAREQRYPRQDIIRTESEPSPGR